MRLATEATGVGIWEWNLITNQIHWDAHMFRIYGLPPTPSGFVSYSTWKSSVLPEDILRREEVLQDTIHTLGRNYCEFRILRPEETSCRYIQAVETIRTNAQGQAEWVVGTNLDITDRKSAEVELRERENQLRLVMNMAPVLISYLDTEFRYLKVNNTYEEWWGKPVGQILGKTVRELVGEQTWDIVRPYLERARSGETVNYDHQLWFPNDSYRWMRVTYVPDRAVNGSVKGIVAHIADIEERKQRELHITQLNQTLKRQVEEMQAIFDTAPIGLSITDDIEGKHIRGNPVIEKLVGLPSGSELSLTALPSTPYRVYQDGQELATENLPMQRAAQGETVANQILEIHRPDGQDITLISNAVPLFDENGIPRGAVGAFLDITELRHTELALRESNERLRLAKRAGGLGIYDHNLDTGKMQWDGRVRELWGVKADEAITVTTFMEKLHPQDRQHVLAAVRRSFDPQGNGEYHAEFRLVRPSDSQVSWLASYGTTTFAKGRPVRLVGFVQDISERKRSEFKLRDSRARVALAVEAVKAAYWDWDLPNNEVFLSPEWKRQIGFEDHELPNRYEEWETRLHPDDRALALKTVENFISGQSPNFELEFRLRHKDWTYRWIHSRAAIVPDLNNNLNYMVGLNLDTTDYKKSREINEQREKIEESFRLNVAGQTLAALAHELNQPLTAISYMADASVSMLQSGNKNPEKLRRTLESCSEQAQRAGQVINQLLSMLQKNELISQPVDINGSVISVLDIFKTNRHPKQEVSLDLAADLPQVMANTLHLQKILAILLQNSQDALEGSGTSGGIITVRTFISPNNPAMVQVTVSDNGIGVLDEERLPKLFEPFHSTKEGGLGMGLAISRALVQAHGGTIWAEQNKNNGLSVHFTLPVIQMP